MRFRLADPGSLNYLGVEPWANNLKLVSINSGTELAVACAIVDASGAQITSFGAATPTSIGDGRRTVTMAVTAVQLSAVSVACAKVTICALAANTGVIVVGGSTVVASAGTRRGIPLNPLDTITLDISNLNLVYLDGTVNGEGVSYLYVSA